MYTTLRIGTAQGDLTLLHEEKSEDFSHVIEKKALEIANVPFEIKDNFLFKFILFKLPNGTGGFIYNSHHIIGDSWTLGLVAKEVTGIYSEILNSTYEEKDFPSYLNYINYEKEYINSDKYIKDKEYWNEVFKTVPEVASIPSMKDSSSKNVSCKGNRENFIISKNKINDIKEFCTKNKISVYNFFMSVYSLYIGRVSNLDDFVIGTPILNRTNFEQKHTMGMFISTAPLRINLDHNLSFTEFSKRISNDTMSILRHQRYPYQTLLEDLRKKDSSIPNLYNVVLSYQITKTIEENSNIKYSTDWIFNGNCADDLQIHLFDLHDKSSITVAYDYKSDKYDSVDISDLHNRILTIINQVISNNDILLKNIEIVTPEEKHKILYEFNNTEVDYPRDKTIVDLFEEQVEKTPDNIAVVFEDEKLTYRELNEKANQLARCLISNNIKVGNVVAILLDKSLEMIISILAILKSGSAFLPIDISYPNERINYIIKNSKANIVLTNTEFSHKVKDTAHFISVDMKNNIFSQYDNTNLNITYTSNDLAYIMYTSGSTGNPKGVMVTHKNIIRLSKNNKFIVFDKEENILQTGSIVFDACTFEIWSALLNGFKLFIIKKETLLNSDMFKNYLESNKISTLWLTAPLFNQLCESNPYIFKGVNKLLTGGDILSPKHITMVRTANPNLTVINGYGPTENTTFSCCFTINKNYTRSIPIGKPISNSTAYVVSNSGLLCPIGIIGELWVGGDGVAKGYLNNNDLTKEKFVINPFGKGIIYKTGDLVKWLPDGNIEFIGRIDNQVKIRGFRVELSEIDNQILISDNSIKQSFSIILNKQNNKTICSYLIATKEIDFNALKANLKLKLPNYMLPNYFVQLDNLPLNINGKIDKKLLPLPEQNSSEHKIIPPENDFEANLLELLKPLVSKNEISVQDDFFDDLSLDSLSTMKLSSLLSNYNITIQDISNHPSIRDLANYVTSSSINNIEVDIANKIDITNKNIYFDLSVPLLTGSIGFLGMHILYELIINNSINKVYCLIRKKHKKTPYKRLSDILDFYFTPEIKEKILISTIIVEGDFAYENLNLDKITYDNLTKNVTTVIHCGANVKHYGKYEYFYKNNVLGTKNIINFCKKSGAKLAHISTTSVGGFSKLNNIKILNEDSLFINQSFNNHVYMISKYFAEVEILNNINNNSISGKIFRIGNMMPRLSDNKFQINLYDNAFISRLKTITELKYITKEYKNFKFDITPVDLCCKAILTILKSTDNYQTIYHIYNPQEFSVEKLLSILNINVKEISKKEMIDKLVGTNNNMYSHLLNDLKNSDFVESLVVNEKTIEYLKNISFEWPILTDTYIQNLINLY